MKKLITITSYQTRGDSFGDFCHSKGFDVNHYSSFDKPKGMFQSKKEIIMMEILAFLKLIFHLPLLYNKIGFVTGNQISTMAVYKIFKYLIGSNKNSHLYIYNFYLHGLSKNNFVMDVMSWLLNNDRITLICQSPNEVHYYRSLSEKCNVEFVPYSSDFVPPVISNDKIKNVKQYNDYCFSGGYTNRDYELIGVLAKRHSERLFVIVASSLNYNVSGLPSNVIVLKDLENVLFEYYLSNSSCVIVALKEDVGSSGQMLAISAMRNKKPIIYTDVEAVNYYFANDCGYPYKIGDIDSLDNAYNKLFSNYDDALSKGQNAYENSKNYTIENCHKRIYQIISKHLSK